MTTQSHVTICLLFWCALLMLLSFTLCEFNCMHILYNFPNYEKCKLFLRSAQHSVLARRVQCNNAFLLWCLAVATMCQLVQKRSPQGWLSAPTLMMPMQIICLLFWCVLLVSHAIIIHSGLCHACGIVLTVPNEDWIRSSTTTRSTSKPCVCLNHHLW